MKIKTSDLIGPLLDWAVEYAKGTCWVNGYFIYGRSIDPGTRYTNKTEAYSTDWSQGGLIIERENITIRPVFHAERTESGTDIYRQDGWAAHVEPKAFWITPRPYSGDTPLVAAMRAFVASKLGDEIEVLNALVEKSQS